MSRRRTLVLWIGTRLRWSGRKALLKRNGYEVTPAKSEREACAVLATFAVDAVILDAEASELNPQQLVCRMKQIKPHIPILVCAAAETTTTDRFSGADAVVLKHDPPARLVQVLNHLLNVRFPFFTRWFGNWRYRAGA